MPPLPLSGDHGSGSSDDSWSSVPAQQLERAGPRFLGPYLALTLDRHWNLSYVAANRFDGGTRAAVCGGTAFPDAAHATGSSGIDFAVPGTLQRGVP